jgi:hypothetical protein
MIERAGKVQGFARFAQPRQRRGEEADYNPERVLPKTAGLAEQGLGCNA